MHFAHLKLCFYIGTNKISSMQSFTGAHKHDTSCIVYHMNSYDITFLYTENECSYKTLIYAYIK